MVVIFYQVLFLFLFLFSSGAFGAIGFHSPEQLPSRLKGIQRNIFQLVAPAGEREIIDISSFTLEDIETFSTESSKNKWRPDIREAVIRQQLLNCQKIKLLLCPHLKGLKASTAFLLNQPRTVISTFHGVSDYLKLIESSAIILGDDVEHPFVLLDSHQKVIRSFAHLIQSVPFENFGGDYIILSVSGLEERSGLPLQKSSHLKSDQSLYAAGFPEQTNDRKNYGGQDAQLDQFTFTKGSFTNLKLLRYTPELREYVFIHDRKNLGNNSLFITDLDSVSGMSGSPLITESGEVIGMLRSGLSEIKNKSALTIFINLLIEFNFFVLPQKAK